MTLPAVTRNWGEKMVFHIQSWQGHNASGQIMVVVPSGGPSWLSSSYADTNSTLYNSQTILLTNTARRHYTVIYEYDINDRWFVNETRGIDQRIPDTLVTQITTNQTAISKQHYFKFFPNDESNYTVASGNHFTLPSGYRQITVYYGDSQENVKADVDGVYLNFPLTPVDGDYIQLVNLHNFNSTNNTDVLVIDWSNSSNQPNGRKLIFDLGQVYEIGGNESSLVETHATSYNLGRKASNFYYVSSTNTWLSRLDSY